MWEIQQHLLILLNIHINEGLIRPAKVTVIACGHLTLFVFGLVLCFGFPRL